MTEKKSQKRQKDRVGQTPQAHMDTFHKLAQVIFWTLLSQKTDGFNGADIEAVVNEAVENCFLADVQLDNKAHNGCDCQYH